LIQFNQEKGILAVLDKSGKPRLVYSSPLVRLPSNKSITLPLEWDAPSSSLSIHLPELSYPLIIAFGLGTKIPDIKGGFGLSFPSFKFGSKGEVEAGESDEEEPERKEKKGGFGLDISLNLKKPKFGKKEKTAKAEGSYDASDDEDDEKAASKEKTGFKVFFSPPFFFFFFFL
jgi:hypothetical protein